jgi:hypothetical protein
MKNSDGAYIQAYNAQAVVDEEHQVITAADVTTNPSDALNYTTMLDQSAANTGVHPKQAWSTPATAPRPTLRPRESANSPAAPTRSWPSADSPTTSRSRPHHADASPRTPR